MKNKKKDKYWYWLDAPSFLLCVIEAGETYASVGYCGARGVKLECDHIIPVSRGGTDEETNLTTACAPCNRSKSNKLLQEWSGGQYA